MTWKTNINDIKVICKSCDEVMVVESTWNDVNAILVCPRCFEHINLKVFK